MKEHYGFFDGEPIGIDDEGYQRYDREFNSDDFADFIESFYATGVYAEPSSGLQVLASDDMNIIISSGRGLIKGRMYRLDGNRTFRITDSDNSKDRIDLVVLRRDLAERKIYPHIIQGIASTNPSKPKMIRDGNIYDICLAEINVKRSISSINQSLIKDTRHFKDVCGIVSHAIKQIDTSELYIQYEKSLANRIDEVVEIINQLNEIIESENATGEIIANMDKKMDKILKDEKNGATYEVAIINGRPNLRVVSI